MSSLVLVHCKNFSNVLLERMVNADVILKYVCYVVSQVPVLVHYVQNRKKEKAI